MLYPISLRVTVLGAMVVFLLREGNLFSNS
jgi:hypothetical protein